MKKIKGWLLASIAVLLLCAVLPREAYAAAHGDFTDDGRISSQDALYLLRHVLNPDGYAVEQSADMNGDGRVNSQDALFLLRHSLNPSAYPLVEDHELKTIPGKAATCTDDGLTEGKVCTVCGKTVQPQQSIPAPGHNYVDGVCGVCGDGGSSRGLQMQLLPDGSGYAVTGRGQCTDRHIVVPSEHEGLPVTAIAAQAFTGSGVESVTLGKSVQTVHSCAFYRCADLKKIIVLQEEVAFTGSIIQGCDQLEQFCFAGDPNCWEKERINLDASVELVLNYGHIYSGQIVTPADCTHQGISKYTCTHCGRVYEQQTAALGHNYAAADQVKPTCTEPGSVDGSCTRCGQHTSTALPALGHQIDHYEEEEAPSCAKTGTEVGQCTLCKQYFERTIAALAHTPGAFVGTGEYCGDREMGSAACTICGQTVYTVEHILHTTTQQPKCTEDGHITSSCTNCDYVSVESIPTTGHIPGSWQVIQETSCTADGVTVKYCTFCHVELERDTLEQHDHVLSAAVEGGVCTYNCRDCDYTHSVTIGDKLTITLITGCEPELPVVYVDAGQVPVLPTPTMENNTFLGWYMDASGKNPYENTPVTEEMTLYARWMVESVQVSDGGKHGIIQNAAVDFEFAVTSPVPLTNQNLDQYISVTATGGKMMEIFVSRSQGDTYYIGGNYTPGDIYQAVAAEGITIEQSGTKPLWFVVSGPERNQATYRPDTVQIKQNQILSQFTAGSYECILASGDILNVGQIFVIQGEKDTDLIAIYEVVGEGQLGTAYTYQCVIANPEDVFENFQMFTQREFDFSGFTAYENWSEAVVESFANSSTYAVFQEAMLVYAQQRSKNDPKYEYIPTGLSAVPQVRPERTSDTGCLQLVVRVEITGQLQRKERATGKLTDAAQMVLVVEQRFGASGSISADHILRGDARASITIHRKATAELVLKLGLMDNDGRQEEYFRNIYKGLSEKKDLLAIDTEPYGDETLIPMGYIPIPIGGGFAFDMEVYTVMDWEICGQFGVGLQHTNTLTIGLELNDWAPNAFAHYSNDISINIYLAGKAEAGIGLRPEVGFNWIKIFRGSINATVYGYAEAGGLVGFAWSKGQPIQNLSGGYLECGVKLEGKVAFDAGGWIFSYHTERDLFETEKWPLLSIGTKDVTLNFESDGEEYTVYMNFDKAIDLKNHVDLLARVQNIGNLEINTQIAPDWKMQLKNTVEYVELSEDGFLKVKGCDRYVFDLPIRITSGEAYKDIVVHVIVDHVHNYAVTKHPGSCTKDEINAYACKVCTYQYDEIVKKAPGHDYSNYIVDRQPTCTENGQKHSNCTRCNNKDTQMIPKLGHAYTMKVLEAAHLYKKATCLNVAQYYYVCVNCGGHNAQYTYPYGDLADHVYPDAFTCHDRKCTTPGCNNISYASTGHIWSEWMDEEPGGCVDVAYSFRFCRDCGLVEDTLDGNTIHAHQWQLQPDLAPTCTSFGHQDYILCVNCGKETKTVVPKLPHLIFYKDITENTHVQYCHRSGCGYESAPINHNHTNWEEIQAPTCEEEGAKQGTCVCGHVKTNALEATGHAHQKKLTKPATCTQTGLWTYTCHCGDSYTEEIPMTSHVPGTPVVENEISATCTVPGSYEEVTYCTGCHKEMDRQSKTIVPKGHTPGASVRENVINPSCTAEGSYDEVIYCTVCGEEMSRSNKTTEKLPHTAGAPVAENVEAATCQKPGSYDAVTHCTVCGEETSRTHKLTDKLPHTAGAPVVEKVVAATCQKPGSYDAVTYCTVCGEEMSRSHKITDKLPHTPGAPVAENVVAATCQKPGSQENVVYCTVCGEELSRQKEEKPLAPCKPNAGAIENELLPTCTAEGSYDWVVRCTECGKELSRDHETTEKLPHTPGKPVEENKVLPTCTAEGSYDWVVRCTECGKELSRDHETTEKLPHTPGKPVEENKVLPTCTAEGSYDEVSRCTVCGEELSRTGQTIPALGHDKQNGTADYDKQNHWVVCGREGCGALLDKVPHTGSWSVVRPSTCAQQGEEKYTCTCGYTATRPMALSDHNHSGKWHSDDAQHYRICPDCSQQIDAQGHDHSGKWQINDEQHYRLCTVCQHKVASGYHIPVQNGEVKKPTCTEGGYTPYRCPECEHTWNSDVTAETGHSWKTEWEYDDRSHYHVCKNCQTEQPGSRYGHILQQEVVREHTCTQPGILHNFCATCGYAWDEETTPHHDHTGAWQQGDGDRHHRICGVCGEAIDLENHNYIVTETVKPDCENPGYTVYTCTVCGRVKQGDQKEALGHLNLEKWHHDSQTNEHYRICDRAGCGHEEDRGSHAFGDWLLTKAPTCETVGTSTRTCGVCGHYEQEQVPALGHIYYDSYETRTTNTSGGRVFEILAVKICDRCGDKVYFGSEKVHIHEQITTLPAKAPTCTEDGLTTGCICAYPGCGEVIFAQETIPALGHDYVDGYCTRCGAASNELRFDLNAYGTAYIVAGIGYFTGTQLEIPATYKGLPVTMIGISAFVDCTNLTSVKIPGSVLYIESSAFYNCKGLTQVELASGVQAVKRYAFKGCTGLTSITLPNSVTQVAQCAFEGCTNLVTVNMSKNVTSIDQYAFKGCKKLANITLGVKVKTVEKYAFAYCDSLTTLYYEGTTEQWNAVNKESKWNYSSNITVVCLGDINGSQGLAYELSDDGTYYIVSGIGTCTDTEIVIPETYQGLPVREIGTDAFANCAGITSISIPEGVTTIGDWAFNQCTGLTEITIPQTATTLGNYLFYNCTSLTEVILPNGVTAVNTYMFYNCTALESVQIPSGVTTIGSFAFYGCTSLNWVELPATVKTIGSQAFYNAGLTAIYIPQSVTTIGTQAFSGCTGLLEIALPDNLTQIGTQVFYNCTSLTKITIPAKVTNIANRAFAYCTSLTEVTIPVSVTTINGRAFQSCTSMQTIYFEGTSAQWEAISKASYWNQDCPGELACLGDYNPAFAFTLSDDGTYYIVAGTNLLTDDHVVIPSMYWGKPVKEIGDFAFAYNTMTSVTIPATIERINNEAFWECYDLTAVYITDLAAWCQIQFGEYEANPLIYAHNLYLNGTLVQNLEIPGTVSDISAGAFQFCDSLVTVTIADGVKSIGYGAFYGCHNLTRVEIPASVTQIGGYAFRGDGDMSLAGIWVDADNPNYSSDEHGVLFNKDQTTLIRAPHALAGMYVIPSTVQTIEADAFSLCDKLTAIVMGKNVTKIGDWAFDCWDLEYTYYCGSLDDWNAMDIGSGNNDLYQTIRYYSETRPTESVSEYWHYVNGVPTIWS